MDGESVGSIPLKEHLLALMRESDRRLSEVALEREKALKIKEQADRDALQLAREIQSYKDEKANNLRTQIEGERGEYATRAEAKAMEEKLMEMIRPFADYVSGQQGRRIGQSGMWAIMVSAIVVTGAVVGILTSLRGQPPVVERVVERVVTVPAPLELPR